MNFQTVCHCWSDQFERYGVIIWVDPVGRMHSGQARSSGVVARTGRSRDGFGNLGGYMLRIDILFCVFYFPSVFLIHHPSSPN